VQVVIAGGTGFLGRALTDRLAASGHDVVVLTRRMPSSAGVRHVGWTPDGTARGDWVDELDRADAVVNLTGAGIADRRWTRARKAVLRSSRVLPTRSLVEAIRRSGHRPAVFLQGSAVGVYGDTGDRAVDETGPPGDDYLAHLGVEWEHEAVAAADLGCRVVCLRTGIVLAADSIPLRKMRLPFVLFVGGPIGSGRQVISWIHLDDWLAMASWALDTDAAVGPVNAVAPGAVSNATFSKALGRALGRPSWLPVPAFALRLIFGELADAALLGGQRVVPAKAAAADFRFRYPDIDAALGAIYG
jgi:uncharacterized protein (TIGR01777 family)